MSFNFGFDVDDNEGRSSQVPQAGPSSSTAIATGSSTPHVPSKTHTLSSLLSTLPARMSYSSIAVPGTSIVLPRRDLFDARFQVLSEDESDTTQVDSESDLVPGVYEGGLKTWECSLDLVGLLSRGGLGDVRNVVELGCGTALPSAYILLSLLLSTEPANPTTLHLCDFNETVLNLVTLPNLILAYALSQSAQFAQTGDLDLTPEFLSSFEAALSERDIELVFHSGPWEGLQIPKGDDKTLILTSETTYVPSGIESLLSVLRSFDAQTTKTLIATKDYYFGLGGGVVAFLDALTVEERETVKTVWTSQAGVRRSVLQSGNGV